MDPVTSAQLSRERTRLVFKTLYIARIMMCLISFSSKKHKESINVIHFAVYSKIRDFLHAVVEISRFYCTVPSVYCPIVFQESNVELLLLEAPQGSSSPARRRSDSRAIIEGRKGAIKPGGLYIVSS